jgi:hypothetical protein
LFSNDLPDPLECFGRIEKQGGSGKIVIKQPIFILRGNKKQFFLNVIGTELEYGIIIFDDFFMKLERRDIDDIDICFCCSEYTCDLAILPLSQVLHSDSLELLHRIGTNVNLKPIRSLDDIPILGELLLQVGVPLELCINGLEDMPAGSLSLQAGAPVSLNYQDLTKKGAKFAVEASREKHFEKRNNSTGCQLLPSYFWRSIVLEADYFIIFYYFCPVKKNIDNIVV